ncbi:MAG TPA: lytic transglycosylase domain-containing protein [Bryobacteraceae bacterium]|nr:lytic transglycosylase domain-containing protein [Bryobacteraceae bacterium]
MHRRKQTLLSFLPLAVALLSAPGCAVNQQSRFQNAFLPPPRPGESALRVDLADYPVVQPNIYLKDLPASLIATPSLPPQKTRGDALVQRAENRFEAGKRYYQAQDPANARREFDAAIDLMLEASDQNPADRQEYERRMDEIVDAIHRYDLAGLGASAAVEKAKFEKAPLEDILQMTFPVDPRLKDRVKEQLAATESQLPLSTNDAVLGYINYFSNRGHKTLVAGSERSGRYRPMIQRILSEEGIPQELIHLAQAESGFMPRAISRKAAGGMWQFVKFRGNEYGLGQTAYTDDRMDPEKATRAAARHLHDLYNEFGDWYLAIAAYNCGPGVVEKAVERTGYADFWELRSRGVLPAETTNYVPIILAMTIMEKNAAEYGLDNLQLDAPVEYDTIQVTAPTSLLLVSDLTDSSPAELAGLNPAVLYGVAPTQYALHVPKGTGVELKQMLERVPAEHRNAWRAHRVGGGETLASIGSRFGATPAAIAAANRLPPGVSAEGDVLLIPVIQRPANSRTSRTAAHTPVRSSRGAAARTANTRRPATRSHAAVSRTKAGAALKPSTDATQPAKKPAAIVAHAQTR